MKQLKIIISLAVLLVTLSTCGSSSKKHEETVLVLAAASLTDAFQALQFGFEGAHPDFKLEFSFAGSGLLREQITEGAPADIFASADLKHMGILEDKALLARPPQIFALNRMQIAVPADNPGQIVRLDDLERSNVLVGLCARGVPCGDFAHEVLERANITPQVVTEEPNVRALAEKIALGELDGGVVYATDVMALAPRLTGIDIADEFNVSTNYPIAVLAEAAHPRGANAFVRYLDSEAARNILVSFGFGIP